jgi:hypothetical protein
MNQHNYDSLEELLSKIDEPNRSACKRLYADYQHLFVSAPGASHNHQSWPGGYADHITDAMNIASVLYDSLNPLRPLPFSKSDALLVVFLHDLEKPFRYTYSDKNEIVADPMLSTQAAKMQKRLDVINTYGIQLNIQQSNALEYIEGVKQDKYSPGERTMGELAALCHCADTLSARLWYNHPLPNNTDTWQGSSRANSDSAEVELISELQ